MKNKHSDSPPSRSFRFYDDNTHHPQTFQELFPAIHSYSSRRHDGLRLLWGNRFYPG